VHPGRFCADCLGLALDIPARQVSMAKHRLTATGALRSEHAPCSGCNSIRLVVTAAGTPAGASVSQATVDSVALRRSISILR